MENRTLPAEAFLPGEYILDFLDARGWTQDDLAEVVGRSRAHINRLISGKTAINSSTANELADAFGTSPELWMNLQTAFELAVVSSKNREISRKSKLYSKVPIRELQKRGWIAKDVSLDLLEIAVCRFLDVPNIDDEPVIQMAATKSTDYGHNSSSPIQTAWYKRTYKLASCLTANRYDDGKFPQLIEELLKLAGDTADLRRISPLLAQYGIRLLFVEHLPKTKLDGAAFWLNDDSPVVALTLRLDRIDNFWHVLIHELIHIKYRDGVVFDDDLLSHSNDENLPDCEKRANDEARQLLVPLEKIQSFIARHKPLYYREKVVQFAKARGVHPGIVVGQLQWRDELEWNQLRKLLVSVREHVIGTALTDGWGDYINLSKE